MAIEKLNMKFVPEQILQDEDMTKIVNKVDEVVDKVNESVSVYNKNGFYISKSAIKVKALRYIAFRDVVDDEWCYLLNINRLLKFNLNTLEIAYETKVTNLINDGVSNLLNSAAFLRVVGDYVYVHISMLNKQNEGFYIAKINDIDGSFVSEEYIPIRCFLAYNNSFHNGEHLITDSHIIAYDDNLKKIVKYTYQNQQLEELTEEIPNIFQRNKKCFFVKDTDGVYKRALVVSNQSKVYIAIDDVIKTIDVTNTSLNQGFIPYGLDLQSLGNVWFTDADGLNYSSVSKTDDFTFALGKKNKKISSNAFYLSYDEYRNSLKNSSIKWSKYINYIGVINFQLSKVDNSYGVIFASNILNTYVKADYCYNSLNYSNLEIKQYNINQ